MRRTVSRLPARVCSLLLLVILASQLVAAPIPIAHAAAIWYVQPAGNDLNDCQTPATACATISAAIGKAAPGDTIRLAVGFYSEIVTINKSIAITGAGAATTTIDGDGVGTVVTINAGLTASIAGVSITGGSNGNAGGIYNQGILTITDSAITSNAATGIATGGGLRNAANGGNASATIIRTTISGNTSGGDGAGISNVTYTANTATLSISDSTISGNTAATYGGGIASYSGGGGTASATLVNTTISGNTATSNDGGGINVAVLGGSSAANLTITNATIANNTAGGIGGGISTNATLPTTNITLSNSIIAGNSASSAPDFQAANTIVTSNGGNLIGNNSSMGAFTPQPSDQIGTPATPINPRLGPLQNNGGSTFTHGLLTASPAIDAGNPPTCAATDQRGVPRPLGARCDSGAVEFGATWYVSPTGSDSNSCLAAAAACRTIAAALGRAAGNETINLAAGTYAANLTIDKNIALIGAGAGITILDGGNTDTVITVSPGALVDIRDVAIERGNGAVYGGIYNQGSLMLSDVLIRNNNVASSGGGTIWNDSDMSIEDSTIVNNIGSTGTLINNGLLSVSRTTIAANSLSLPGGAISSSGNTSIHDSAITGNNAGNGGAIWGTSGTLNLENVTVSGNTASGTGGGLVSIAPMTITVLNSTFANNAPAAGGNIVMQQGTLTLRNTIIANSAGANCGGGIIDGGNNIQFPGISCGSTMQVGDPLLGPLQNNGGSTFTHALLGGSPAIDAGNNATCTLADQRGVPRPQGNACDIGAYERGATTLHVEPAGNNTADCLTETSACKTIGAAIGKASPGDTISIAAGSYPEHLTLGKSLLLLGQSQDTTIIDGSGPGRGVTIASGTVITLTGLTIANGTLNQGAGIFNAGTLALLNSTVSNNTAPTDGGGFYNTGSALIVESTISGNSAQYGAGLYNTGQLSVVRSTISGNHASAFGSGLQNWGTTTIRNSTFAENSATVTGGGLYSSGGSVTLINSTVVNNTAASYGGGVVGDNMAPGHTVLVLANTIVANNSAPANPDIAGLITSQGHNLVRNPAGASGLNVTDLQNVDPLLGALRDNGGPTFTNAPAIGSPAIDAGNPASCAPLDQRSIIRPQGASCDIGAIESASATSAILSEVEPNNFIELANLLTLNSASSVARSGTISATTDLDIYTFNVQPGATVAISLTNLPADYDLALLSDPRDTIPVSDSIDLSSIADNSRSDASGELDTLGQTSVTERINAIGQLAIGQLAIGQLAIGQLAIGQLAIGQLAISTLLSGASANQGTQDESIISYLPRGGQYFIIVYGNAGSFDKTWPYRLNMTVQEGGLKAAKPNARPISSLNATVDPSVRTIYLFNSARMRARYPQQIGQTFALTSTLQSSSPLLTLQNARGISIDLGGQSGGARLLPKDLAAVTSLYSAWDSSAENRRNPLQANELAQQIWYVLDRAVTNYYTGTTDIVLVGGDDIIPFYRVPDEVPLANESSYQTTLNAKGALAKDSPLEGSLFFHFMQTDNFYADRSPTPWRGRALYIPDLGIGRLVEQPAEIMHYLNSYLTPNQYVIDASNANAAALVTGYDFMRDQANAIASTLDGFGFKPSGVLGTSETLKTLISDTWNVNDLTAIWFSGQLPNLTSTYNGPRTKYQLMSINGHFSHYDSTPANAAAGDFFADQLLNPTATSDTAAYFHAGTSAALIYSVGCHSGLNVLSSAINIGAPAFYSADFPQAVLKQGGNWIGNTGYGYGDSDMIGYSERLAALFTEQIGRDPSIAEQLYTGAAIGDSLARAKRGYVLSNGPGGFSVYDEKVLEEMTLYGLPFIRVKVPQPSKPANLALPAIPQNVLATLSDKNPIFTRTIRVTNSFSNDSVPQVTSTVNDSFRSEPVGIRSEDQMSQGRPVLPALTYDITLLPTSPGAAIAIPRGVRLLSAKTLPDLENFNPHVTTPVTDQIYAQQQEDPTLRARALWLPDLPYAIQRTEHHSASGGDILTDQLVIAPAQFYASNGETGELRRFTEMVFEVTYIEPQIAAAATLAQSSSPLFNDVRITPLGPSGATTIQAAGQLVRFSALVSDTNGSLLREVSATYTSDGLSWQRKQLLRNAATGRYEATLSAPGAGADISAFFESLDNAGNVTVETRKGTLAGLEYIFLPTFSKQGAADLIGSLRLSPSQLAFTAGAPVMIDVTITNNGSVRAAPFWADLYINPSAPPTAANRTWNLACGMTPCFGIAWTVPGGLDPGDSITLHSAPGEFAAAYSIWPGYFARGTTDLYLYVDSWNPGVASGAVPESNEGNNRAELHGLVVTGPNPQLISVQSAGELPERPAP